MTAGADKGHDPVTTILIVVLTVVGLVVAMVVVCCLCCACYKKKITGNFDNYSCFDNGYVHMSNEVMKTSLMIMMLMTVVHIMMTMTLT